MVPKPTKKDKLKNATQKNNAVRKELSARRASIKGADSKAPKATTRTTSKAVEASLSPNKPTRQPSEQLFKQLTKIIAEQRRSGKAASPKVPIPIGAAGEQRPSLVPKFKHDKTNAESGQSDQASLFFKSKSFVSKQSTEINPSSFETKKTLFEPKPLAVKQPFVSMRPAPAHDPKVLSVDKRERKIDIVGIRKPGEKIQKKKMKPAFARMIRKIKEPKFIDQSDQKDQRRSCRICFSSQCNSKTGYLIVPCNCRGIFSTVHQRCISDWIVSMCSDTCDICRFKFFIQAKHKGLIDFIVEEQQFHFIWQTLTIICFSLYLIFIASAFVQIVEHYAFLTDDYTLAYKISCSVLIFVLLCYVGYYFSERAISYREWRKYKYHITVKPNPNYRISELITPPSDIIRSSGLGQYSIKPLIRPVL